MRTDIRWDDQEPIAQLLRTIPPRQRAKLLRAIIEAALLPGGWAKLAAHPGIEHSNAVDASEAAHPVEALPVKSDDAPLVGGMSPGGARGFLAGLRQFGALEDH